MPQILKPSELSRRLAAGETVETIFGGAGSRKLKLVAPSGMAAAATAERTVDFIITTGRVDRELDTLKLGGWDLDAYADNPVVLWAHDDTIPAIARAFNVRFEGDALKSSAAFAERDIHPLADTVYQLIKGGFISAASVGFAPLRAQLSTDPARRGGLDILEQELLEWSAVNVPANPDALIAARSSGVDTGPIFTWAERALDSGGMVLVPKTELETLRKAAKMPAKSKPVPPAPAAGAPKAAKSLWHVADLATCLYSLGYLEERISCEAEIEGDNSPVPAALLSAMQSLGQVLVDMTVEEVNEFLARGDDEVVVEVVVTDVGTLAAATPAKKALSLLSRVARQAKAAEGRRFVLQSKTGLSKETGEKLARRLKSWQGSPDDVLLLDEGQKLVVIEPPARLLRSTTIAAAEPAPEPAVTPAPGLEDAVKRLERRVRALEHRGALRTA